jgi:AtzE family amidohydrolase
MIDQLASMGVVGIAHHIRLGRMTAQSVAVAALDAVARVNPHINAATRELRERAMAEAVAVDAKVAAGEDPGPLAGVPYGVKDLFDLRGLPTTAGSGRLRSAPSAASDAIAVSLLRKAGAVLVATLNMDEFAYGFVTDNATWGVTRNPHALDHFAGGSSGGSAAIVAAGAVAFSLGSDTNGSIRIPASLCGIFGTKPTHGSLPMEGVYPFVHSLDDIGIFAKDATDLKAVDAVLRGDAAEVPFSGRTAILGGWFQRNLAKEMAEQLKCLQVELDAPTVTLPDVQRARSAAFLITAYEGGQLHRPTLATDAMGYDPNTRDRLIAGAALSEDVYRSALGFRDEFSIHVEKLFNEFDVLIAPSTYGPAPLIDDPFVSIDGRMQSARANLGLYTQPISFLGFPVVAAPLPVADLPCGVQLIGRKGSDRALLSYAEVLSKRGLVASRLPCPPSAWPAATSS